MTKATRVLWFTNTPSLASRILGEESYLGGWISSLEKEISQIPEVELAIAFPCSKPIDDFAIESTKYYPISQKKEKGKISGLWERWIHKIESSEELLAYRRIISNFNPDIIHVFGSERSFGLIADGSEIPLILQIQGNLSVYLEKWFSGISFLEVVRHCRKKDFALGYGIFHSYFLFKKRADRERNIFERCHFFIGRTDWDKRVTGILAPKGKYFHCDEILRKEFRDARWHYRQKTKKILVTTISPLIYKGLETIIKTANLLRTKGNFDFEWIVAGVNGKEDIITITEHASRQSFVENNIRFAGSLNANELINKLLNADCYVHPSHIENSPNSICEAMMVGVPIIATYAGGTPSILLNGEEGILVQDGDPFAMAGAIIELINSPERMNYYSDNARQKALTRHNPDTIVNSLINIYKEVLESN
jgi:glycosyltransferase involved in cell wall biosynthesis